MFRKILKAVCLAPPALLLCQCDAMKPKPKAPSPYAYTVLLKFTPMAEAAMNRTKDTIDVDAYYYGDPTPAAASRADKLGRLVLGDETVGWSGNTRRVHLEGTIDASLLKDIRGEPQVLISVMSRTNPDAAQDQLIHCKTWIGTVKMARERSPVIGCELDAGDKESADDLTASAEAESSQ